MQRDSVVGVFESNGDARQVIAILDRQGWVSNALLITRGDESELDDVSPMDEGDQMERSAGIGAAAGAALGLLASSALLIIPGIGPVLFVGAMAGGITGGLVGGIVGAMSGWGIDQDHVRQYEQELKSGKSLVLVTGEPRRLAEIQSLLEDSNAERVVRHALPADAPVDS